MKSLPIYALKVFRAYIIILFILADMLFLFLFLLKLISLIILILLMLAGFCSFFILYFFLIQKYYNGYKYHCSCNGLSIAKGYLLKRKITVLKEKVIYTEIYSNPLQKHFSLCSIGVFCSGTGRILLSQINLSEAERIKEILCEENS